MENLRLEQALKLLLEIGKSIELDGEISPHEFVEELEDVLGVALRDMPDTEVEEIL